MFSLVSKIFPWNWPIIRRFEPRSNTGKFLWRVWWGLSALPGPNPAWFLLAWIAYQIGFEKEVTAVGNWLLSLLVWVVDTAGFLWTTLVGLVKMAQYFA